MMKLIPRNGGKLAFVPLDPVDAFVVDVATATVTPVVFALVETLLGGLTLPSNGVEPPDPPVFP